jgi:DUF4097 and DUF4098 domain-containing protein YvlB
MPSFPTPAPVSVVLNLPVGDVRLTASERDDTVVRVQPSDSQREQDQQAAEQARVEYTDGTLEIRVPKQRGLGMFGTPGSVDVTIDLPAGSRLRADTAVAAVHGTGRLGECRVTTATGDVELGETGPLEVRTAAGAIAVQQVAGGADVSTGSGRVRLGTIDGPAVIKNSNGDIHVAEVTGDLRAKTANGDITIGRCGTDVTASTARGDVRVAGIRRGTAALSTGSGDVEIGVEAGTAARLDVHTRFGAVRNQMDAADRPEPSDQTAEVRARTSYGDIVIRRAAPAGLA